MPRPEIVGLAPEPSAPETSPDTETRPSPLHPVVVPDRERPRRETIPYLPSPADPTIRPGDDPAKQPHKWGVEI